jgi:hypothetical protein
MSHDRFGIGVPMVRIAKHDSLVQQVIESAFAEPVAISEGQIATQLVDGNLQHECGLRIGLRKDASRQTKKQRKWLAYFP